MRKYCAYLLFILPFIFSACEEEVNTELLSEELKPFSFVYKGKEYTEFFNHNGFTSHNNDIVKLFDNPNLTTLVLDDRTYLFDFPQEIDNFLSSSNVPPSIQKENPATNTRSEQLSCLYDGGIVSLYEHPDFNYGRRINQYNSAVIGLGFIRRSYQNKITNLAVANMDNKTSSLEITNISCRKYLVVLLSDIFTNRNGNPLYINPMYIAARPASPGDTYASTVEIRSLSNYIHPGRFSNSTRGFWDNRISSVNAYFITPWDCTDSDCDGD